VRFSFTFLYILFAFFGNAQTIYDELTAESKGKVKTLKIKRSYGAVDKIEVKTGIWKYFDANGILLKEEQYEKSSESSVKHGIWSYYNQEGELVREEAYVFGKMIRLRLHLSDSLVNGKEAYKIECDSLICREWVYYDDAFKYQRTTSKGQWKDVLSTFNPNTYMDDLPEKDAIQEQYVKALNYQSSFRGPQRTNLLKNGSFSEVSLESTYIEGIADYLPHWLPASGTPDYFAMAPDTNGTVGIRVATAEGSYLEYVAQKLEQPLRAGFTYGFRMKVKLAAASAMAADAMGAWFGPKVMDFGYFSQLQLPDPQIKHPEKVLLVNTDRWVWVEGDFVAKGDERFVVIGSFMEQRNMKLESFKGAAPEAYYLVDDVELFVLNASKRTTPFDHLKKGDILTLENVWFENDRDELLPQSLKTLDELIQYLNLFPERKIAINGHTSSVGDYQHNGDLSDRRSKQVKAYLVSRGIADARLTTRGFGPDKPLADNNTLEGQALNRRVEVEVLE